MLNFGGMLVLINVICLLDVSIPPHKEYDYNGAMYFAVAVILIYGISIAFLIGTTLRKNRQVRKIDHININYGHHKASFHITQGIMVKY